MGNEVFTPIFFVVELDGIQTARFLECTGLEMETTIYEIEEGGFNTSTHKFIGKTRAPNIVLKKGISYNNELLKWYQKNINGNFERKNGSVILMNSSCEEMKRWDFFKAFPCRWIVPRLDVNDNKFAIEVIEISHC